MPCKDFQKMSKILLQSVSKLDKNHPQSRSQFLIRPNIKGLGHIDTRKSVQFKGLIIVEKFFGNKPKMEETFFFFKFNSNPLRILNLS